MLANLILIFVATCMSSFFPTCLVGEDEDDAHFFIGHDDRGDDDEGDNDGDDVDDEDNMHGLFLAGLSDR